MDIKAMSNGPVALPPPVASALRRQDVPRSDQQGTAAAPPTAPASYVQYQLDLHTRTVQVSIVDQGTGAVIRQIPSEAMARFAQSWDAYVGRLLDQHT